MTADAIREQVGEKIWKKNFKFSITRNPWDLVVVKFFYFHANETRPVQTMMTKDRILKYIFTPSAYIEFMRRLISTLLPKKSMQKQFDEFVMGLTLDDFNEYYFTKDGKPSCDYYMRYEHLKKDYATVVKNRDSC